MQPFYIYYFADVIYLTLPWDASNLHKHVVTTQPTPTQHFVTAQPTQTRYFIAIEVDNLIDVGGCGWRVNQPGNSAIPRFRDLLGKNLMKN